MLTLSSPVLNLRILFPVFGLQSFVNITRTKISWDIVQKYYDLDEWSSNS